MAIKPHWILTVYMGETAGLIFLGGDGELIDCQYSRGAFELMWDEIKLLFVLIFKNLPNKLASNL